MLDVIILNVVGCCVVDISVKKIALLCALHVADHARRHASIAIAESNAVNLAFYASKYLNNCCIYCF